MLNVSQDGLIQYTNSFRFTQEEDLRDAAVDLLASGVPVVAYTRVPPYFEVSRGSLVVTIHTEQTGITLHGMSSALDLSSMVARRLEVVWVGDRTDHVARLYPGDPDPAQAVIPGLADGRRKLRLRRQP